MTRRRVTSQRIAERHAISATDQTDMLEVKYINPSKGRGVFALSPFQKGDFVVEYRGEMIDFKESERRRRTYDTKGSVFMFDFLWHGRKWCIDAASEDGSLGRLVNDDHVHPNCKIKRISADGNLHLCLFADKDIDRGEEITYDYRDSNWPWREKGGEDCPVMSTENVTLPCSSSPVMQDKEEAAPSIMQGGEDCPVMSTENVTLPCSSSPVMQDKEEAAPSIMQAVGGDSPVLATENVTLPCSSSPVMQDKEELSPSIMQGGSGDSLGMLLKNSFFVCSSSVVLQDTKVVKEAKLTLVNYTDSDETAIISNTDEDFPSSSIQVPLSYSLSIFSNGGLSLNNRHETELEQGRLAEFKGKSLDEIYIDPRETIPLDKHSDIEESEEDLAEVMSERDQERDAEVVPDMSPLQKRKRSGLLQENEGETHSEADDIPVQKAQSKRTRTLLKRRPWDTEEITAVEKHLMSFIRTCRVPGKGDCVKCLTSEPKALRNRTWTAVKFYIKNRITALKRKI